MFKTDSWSPGSFGDTHLVREGCRNLLGPEVGCWGALQGGGCACFNAAATDYILFPGLLTSLNLKILGKTSLCHSNFFHTL